MAAGFFMVKWVFDGMRACSYCAVQATVAYGAYAVMLISSLVDDFFVAVCAAENSACLGDWRRLLAELHGHVWRGAWQRMAQLWVRADGVFGVRLTRCHAARCLVFSFLARAFSSALFLLPCGTDGSCLIGLLSGDATHCMALTVNKLSARGAQPKTCFRTCCCRF